MFDYHKISIVAHTLSMCYCSIFFRVRSHNFRNPVAQSTDGSRGKIGFRQGRHAWEVMWEGPLGTVAVVGISTREAALQVSQDIFFMSDPF